MTSIILKIFLISALINLFWEAIHSKLYKSKLKENKIKYKFIIIIASILDGVAISLIYFITVLIFNNESILNNIYQIVLFIILALLTAFIIEKIALKINLWSYKNKMLRIINIGITPLIQLATTGIITFIIVFLI